MKKKVLFVATTAKGHLNVFHIPYIKMFCEKGWQVDCATNGDERVPFVSHEYSLSIERSPIKVGNLKAIWQLRKIMKREKYDLVICHTPMGGVVGRIAAHMANMQHVIYMAHGFHFYKGASFVNTLIYKNIERFLARWTDGLIVINGEDYEAAKKFQLRKNGKLFLTNGIGVDINRIRETVVDKKEKRKELGIAEDAFVILNIGEFIKRKNQITAMKALAGCDDKNMILAICGRGELEQELRQKAKELNIEERVVFCGFRRDINEILYAADVFLFPSFQEGLPVSVMEAMAAGLPVVCSDIRGNRDLIDTNGGFLVEAADASGMQQAIEKLYQDEVLRKTMGTYNQVSVEKYTLPQVMEEMKKIYEEILQESL